MAEDVAPHEAGVTLVHEHLWAAFGRASGDPDLELTCAEEIVADAMAARTAGVRTIVDVTAADMGADVGRAVGLAERAGLRLVKSTGWFRSPSADAHVAGRAPAALEGRLVADLREGFEGTAWRAGCLGEVGLAGTSPTDAERRVLDAVAGAARSTGAGVVVHTDDVRNGAAAVGELLARGVDPARLLVGHLRAADPLTWQLELAALGCTLGFDQVGHPARDGPGLVAARIAELRAAAPSARVALSGDVGRRSRLRAFGGDGYGAAVLALRARLSDQGFPEAVLTDLTGGAAAAFLALPEPA